MDCPMQGLLDVALLTANANQLRNAVFLEDCNNYKLFLVIMISLSIVLQIIAAALLFIEKLSLKQKKFKESKRYKNIRHSEQEHKIYD